MTEVDARPQSVRLGQNIGVRDSPSVFGGTQLPDTCVLMPVVGAHIARAARHGNAAVSVPSHAVSWATNTPVRRIAKRRPRVPVELRESCG